jgi:glyoxylase-like metal-dependent hydrolase (beta-lactamase superfamily II)
MRKFFFIVLFSIAAMAQQPDFSKIEEKVEKVGGNVYMLQGINGFGGGNIGVTVGEDGVVIVDDQFAPLAPKIEAALKGITDKPVKFVLNTHWHGDHTHGNVYWSKKSVIIAHDNVRKRMEADKEFEGPNTPTPKEALPVVTFDHGVTVHLNGEEVRGLHVPDAHTDTDTIVIFTKSNVVHMGDILFNGMFPFIDLESGGTIKGYIAGVESALKEIRPDTKVIAGHGPLATRADVEKYLAMLRETSSIVEQGLKQGKTADQMKKEKVLAKYDDWGKGFMSSDKYVEELVAALKGEKKNPKFE